MSWCRLVQLHSALLHDRGVSLDGNVPFVRCSFFGGQQKKCSHDSCLPAGRRSSSSELSSFPIPKRKTRLRSQPEAGYSLPKRSKPYLEIVSLPVGAGGGVDGGGAFSQQAETPNVAAARAAKTKYLTRFIRFKTRFPSDFQVTTLGFGRDCTGQLNHWYFRLHQPEWSFP
jgi:hypothetical protein